ncbi:MULTISPECIES: hypothetical protein [Priestia]|nr:MULTISPECIES: hypothetical protein [Priestia]MCG7315533.1 hypothetical protein [Priestia flexa]MEC0667237.1 hypothetical protein [Priestia flexa]MEC0668547.1 hypothetical protein [Priestia flexa]SCC55341.1 hypothetical protein GA0061087_10872 [Priestia flexa]
MGRENKAVLSNFVYGDRFELNSYLTYLFHQFYDYVSDQSENQMIKQ